MFSSITIASSTRNPTASVRAISDRLSMLKFSSAMTENVPTIAIGSVKLGMSVATMLRRKTKITITTRPSARNSENFTSSTECWIETERSYWMCTLSVFGSPFSISASIALALLAISTVFVPGWRLIIRKTVRSLPNQAPPLLFCTSSRTLPSSPSLTGAPFFQETISRLNSVAFDSCPVAWIVSVLSLP